VGLIRPLPGVGSSARVAAPDYIVLKRHRDLDGRQRDPLVRRSLLGLLGILCLLGLIDLFGQLSGTTHAATAQAELSVSAPSRVRSGLLYTARFEVRAHVEIKKATLVLDQGWFENVQVNSYVPQPMSQASRDGRVAFDFGHIAAGHSYVFYLQFQLNPTDLGRRSEDVELDDGTKRIVRIERTATVFP
jgi:hypothetical protein